MSFALYILGLCLSQVVGESVVGESCAPSDDHINVDDTASLLATDTRFISRHTAEGEEQQAVATEETGPWDFHGLKTHRSTLKGTSCDCLRWHHVYADYGVSCGNGDELRPTLNLLQPKCTELCNGGSDHHIAMGVPICQAMFTRINDNFCVNRNWGTNPEQWCYVDSACPSATPLPGHTRVATKTCGPGDNRLSDYSFWELGNITIHDRMDIPLGLVASYAYRHWTADNWEAVHSQFESATGPTRSDLQQLVASNQPYIFNSTSGRPPFHLVQGNSVYEIGLHPGHDSNSLSGRWGSVNMMLCRRGCP